MPGHIFIVSNIFCFLTRSYSKACSVWVIALLFPFAAFSQNTPTDISLDFSPAIAVPEDFLSGEQGSKKSNSKISAYSPLTAISVEGLVTDAYCHGTSDGSIQYDISGLTPPYTYNWSNGKSGKILGSRWNLIELNNPGTSLTDYQIRIDLTYFPGMNEDFSDIRFSDTANTTLLHYWLESYTDSSNAVFWVKVPLIPSGKSKIRVSYGNPSAASLSDGAATFDYFEDFDNGSVSGWTQNCQNISEASESCDVNLHAQSKGYSMRLNGYASCGAGTVNGVGAEVKKNITLPAGQYKIDITTKLNICLYGNCSDSARVYSSAHYGNSLVIGYWFVQQENTCSCQPSIWFEARSNPFTSSGTLEEVKLRGSFEDCGNGYVLQDNFRIRKFSAATPVVTVGPPEHLALTGLSAGEYTITVSDNSGSEHSQTFTVNQPVLPSATGGIRCGEGTVDLSASGPYISYNWYESPSESSSLASSFTYKTDNVGASTTYYLAGVGNNGCESTPRIPVEATVHPLPSTPVVENVSRCGPGSVMLKANGEESLSYAWYTTSSGGVSVGSFAVFDTPVITHFTTYYVSTKDSNGCESVRIPVSVNIDQDCIVIYPAISPNGDLLNDSWVIDGIENFPENKVSVFDRWGSLVYECDNYNNTEDRVWKGKSNRGIASGERELPDGTYFYVIELGEVSSKSGYVVIKR